MNADLSNRGWVATLVEGLFQETYDFGSHIVVGSWHGETPFVATSIAEVLVQMFTTSRTITLAVMLGIVAPVKETKLGAMPLLQCG